MRGNGSPLANSMSALSWLYTVAAGFAVIASVQTFALDSSGRVDFRFGGDLVVFLIFMSAVVRFTHGAMRHFYASYTERTEGWVWYEPPADFLGLFAEAFFFLLMAFSLRDHLQFTVYYLCLLLADSLWLCAIPARADPPYKNWLVANVLFFLFTAPIAAWRGSQDSLLLPVLAGSTAVHHFLDHFAPGNWKYYFPGVTQPGFSLWIDTRLGPIFARLSGLLWWVVATSGQVITLSQVRRGCARSGAHKMHGSRDFKRPIVYLAAPLFTEGERKWNAHIKEALELGNGVEVFSPWERCSGLQSAREIFAANSRGLEEADLVVAVLNGSQVDDGTAWEIGRFFQLKGASRVIGLLTDIRQRTEAGEPVNVMIAQSVRCIVRDEGKLIKAAEEALGELK